MLVSLISYSQYPAVKAIGKDSVVIMTVKQGQEINQKFLFLNDSITSLNRSLFDKNSEILFLSNEKQKLNNNLLVTSEKVNLLDNEIKRLNTFIVKQDRQHWDEKIRWGGWMFFSFVLTVVLGSLK